MDIGTRLKNARALCGLTQGEAADKIGVSRQTLSNWEKQSVLSRYRQYDRVQ